ncbi:MAG: hypothetical protein B7Z37_22365 [Verrucomicrobia bacterium 12-59-8]|nr:MAG: hypothetical protein B7Z37_22365 [Verrucomicrobia bacterium 12-59-8]
MTEESNTHGPRDHTPLDLHDGPILAGVRRVKEELSNGYGHDVRRLFDHLRTLQTTSGRRYVDHRTHKHAAA